MTRIEHTLTIERPVDEVWDYLMDARNDPVWMAHVVEVGRGADQPARARASRSTRRSSSSASGCR